MKTVVIYHRADFDGLFCREIARKFLPDAELIGWDFGDDPVKLPSVATDPAFSLYILDLPVDRTLGLQKASSTEVFRVAPNIIWIDHHKSSIETHAADIPGYRIDGVAACRLAWQWFNAPGPLKHLTLGKQDFIDRTVDEPLAVRLAGEYDIWDKRDPDAEVFQFGLRSRELNDITWKYLLGSSQNAADACVSDLLENGKILQSYQQRNDAGMMFRSFLVNFEGLKFLALTTARCNSLTFASKDIPETGHDALMGFYYTGTEWGVSLYHAKHRTDLDLSIIAVKHGGGGHRGACGFQAATLPFLR